MDLFQVLLNIQDFGDDETIYVVEPWTLQSETRVIKEPEQGLIHIQDYPLIFEYFLEVIMVKQLFKNLASPNTCLQEQCQRIIEYALYNA